MMVAEGLSLDARAIVLVCSSLGMRRGATTKPFGPRGWARIAERLAADGGEPVAMLTMGPPELERLFDGSASASDDAERLRQLLGRSGQLGFELERLASLGIWIRTLADDDYPSRLRARLGPDAPPVLFGAGERSLLERGSVAIVGSRDVDDAGIEATRRLASAVARAGAVVVSGGARGVDQISMAAAFDSGGSVAGVLPEGVERRIRESTTRQAIADALAVVVSPWHPSAGFSAGAAMARNKLIYALSDAAVVISSASGSGGTWAGAIEALDHDWVPVLVRSDAGVPAGNVDLIARGARPIELSSIDAAIDADALLKAAGPSVAPVPEPSVPYKQQDMSLVD